MITQSMVSSFEEACSKLSHTDSNGFCHFYFELKMDVVKFQKLILILSSVIY